MGISASTAYKIIRQLDQELAAQGYITIAEKVSRGCFEEIVSVYTPFNELMARCLEKDKKLSQQEFCGEVDQLVRDGLLEQEEDRLYFPRNKTNEDIIAGILAEMLFENQLPHTQIPDVLSFGDITLTEEQKRTVSLALYHRLSIIQGGAGSGKTTMVRAIIQQYNKREGPVLLCAPTGKAASNLQQRTGLWGLTVHTAFASAFRALRSDRCRRGGNGEPGYAGVDPFHHKTFLPGGSIGRKSGTAPPDRE